MPERTLTVRIVGDDRSLQQAFKRSAKGGQELKLGVSGVGSSIAKGFIGAAAGVASIQTAFKVLGDSVGEASALNEEVSKSKQIFGDSSSAVVKWSDTTASAMGISKRAALEATGIFGNLFATVGLAPQQSAEMSRSLVQLAADLASFNNASPDDVLEAIRSGLIGEAEPMRRYGVLLSETRVQQRAMADTGKTVVTQLTNQEKALARYEIILQDTKKAQGDFSRTSGGLANQQRILAANVKNLEGKIGAGLIPVLLDATQVANGLTEALTRIGDVDIFGASGSSIFGWVSGWKEIGFLIDHSAFAAKDLKQTLDSTDFSKLSPGQLPGVETPFPALTFTTPDKPKPKPKIVDPFADVRRDMLEAQRTARRGAREFDAFVKGLGLKLDKAAITASLDDDLAGLRELERGIQKRIAVYGNTFKLAALLTDTRARIASTVAEQAAASKQKSQDAFDTVIDALNLDLEIARTTRGFNDDLRALKALEDRILKRIRAEGRTTDLLRQLFENRQAQAQTLRDATKASQFEALGLTAEGDKPVAGRSALLKRARSLQEQIKGTVLDTDKTRRQLARIVKVLTDTTHKAGRDVRSAILSMLNEISGALDGGSDSGGALTKFGKRGVNKLIDGLGLSTDQIKEIRQRFSQFGRLDFAGGAGGGHARPPGRTVRPTNEEIATRKGERDVTVNVYIDGSRVEASVTRRQQKKRGRNAPQRRGVNPGARR